MTPNRRGYTFTSFWPYYLTIALHARDETKKILAENPALSPEPSITAIIMSAFAVEAFVNELAEMAGRVRPELENYGIPSSSALDKLQDLANTLMEVEEGKGSITLKYQIAFKILSVR